MQGGGNIRVHAEVTVEGLGTISHALMSVTLQRTI